jgi:hypothetical protein
MFINQSVKIKSNNDYEYYYVGQSRQGALLDIKSGVVMSRVNKYQV